jgi:restriction system protein
MVPTFDAFALPTLRLLAAQPQGLARAQVIARVADAAGLSEADRLQTVQNGSPTYAGRIGWALSYLRLCGWAETPRRSWWSITDAGRARAAGGPITTAELRKRIPRRRSDATTAAETVDETAAEAGQTPEERIDHAVAELHAAVHVELLARLKSAQPVFFERTVLKLLEAMGYTWQRGTTDHLGRTADGGIDGVLYLDRLHLERVYVQAKRYQGTVGSSAVRDFAGAMDGESATKGVILTTASFSAEARKYLDKSPKAIRLVDGDELARLLIEFEVAVSRSRTVHVVGIDEDFFEDA